MASAFSAGLFLAQVSGNFPRSVKLRYSYFSDFLQGEVGLPFYLRYSPCLSTIAGNDGQNLIGRDGSTPAV
jgi:hypothetical protein